MAACGYCYFVYLLNCGSASAIVFAELVFYIEETRLDEGDGHRCSSRPALPVHNGTLKVKLDTRVQYPPLKQFPDMRTHNKGRNVLITFEEDVGVCSPPTPVGWAVTTMQPILHVLRRSCAAICLEMPSLSMESIQWMGSIPVPRWGQALWKASRHTLSRSDTNCANLIRQRCPLSCQRDRKALQPPLRKRVWFCCP